MREFLDDAHQHRDDGYSRAQAHVKRELPKRFYKAASAMRVDGGFAATLDGRVPKTPGQKQVVVPNEAIATALAGEWNAQGEFIDPETMPLLRLVNSAVEAGPEAGPALRAEIVKYAANDLLLYRVEHPAGLVARQEEVWDSALVKLARRFGVTFQPTLGIVHQPQPPATLARLDASLEGEDHFVLAGLNAITSITGSGLLAIGLRQGLLDAEAVWVAAHLDEDFNVSQWGEVEEITVRRGRRRKEFDAAVRLMDLLSH